MTQREARGMETTQTDRWGRKEPWGETHQDSDTQQEEWKGMIRRRDGLVPLSG